MIAGPTLVAPPRRTVPLLVQPAVEPLARASSVPCAVQSGLTQMPPAPSPFSQLAQPVYGITAAAATPVMPSAASPWILVDTAQPVATNMQQRQQLQPAFAPGFTAPIPSVAGASAVDAGVESRATDQLFDVPSDVVELIFVRHGLSLNNTFKEELWENGVSAARLSMMGIEDVQQQWSSPSATRFQRGYVEVCYNDGLCGDYSPGAEGSIAWEIGNMSRDCLLHPAGKNGAGKVAAELGRVFPHGIAIQRFFTSPLRRTIETLFIIFAAFIKLVPNQATTKVALQPWLHERYASDSDLALDGAVVASFVERMSKVHGLVSDSLKAAIGLEAELQQLGDWVHKSGRPFPEDEDDRFPLESGDDTVATPYYPKGMYSWAESDSNFQERVTIIRRWLTTLSPGKRYVLVSHSRVGEELFKEYAPNGSGRLANNGIVVAQYRPTEANPDEGGEFFTDVELARDKWECDVPGWEEEDE